MDKSQSGFCAVYFRMFFHPAGTFRQLSGSKKRLRYGLLGAFIPAAGYMLFYIFASRAGGAPSVFKPWLAVPVEKYFTWGIFLALPGYLISIFSASCVLYLLVRLFDQKSDFDTVFMIVGLGSGVASWSTLLHDLTDAVLSFLGIISMKEYERLLNAGGFWDYLYKTLMVLYLVWFIGLYCTGITSTMRIKRIPAFIISVLSFVTFQAVLLIFIR